MKYPLVTIFILTWNRKNDVINAIKSIEQQTYNNYEILIVDNASTDGTVELVKKTFPNARVVVLDKNYGCVIGRNKGIEYAHGEFIFFVDDDGILHPKAVELAYKTFQIDERIGIVGGRVIPFNSFGDINQNINIQNESLNLDYSFHGGVSMHKKSIYQITGHYPNYFYGAEEQYLSFQLLKNNLFVVKNNSVILWHKLLKTNRSNRNELINRQVNSIANKIKLWPYRYLIPEILISTLKNLYQAIKYKVGLKYFIFYPKQLLIKALESIKDRKPLSQELMNRFFFIKKHCRIELNDKGIAQIIKKLVNEKQRL